MSSAREKRSGRGQEVQVPKPDLALLDIDMPKMSGMDALMEIIKHDDEACVIVLTSVAMSSVVDDCLLFGAKDCVRKDTPADELVTRIKSVLTEHYGD
jgi:DNA-binding NarL/FixJ family response regulator